MGGDGNQDGATRRRWGRQQVGWIEGEGRWQPGGRDEERRGGGRGRGCNWVMRVRGVLLELFLQARAPSWHRVGPVCYGHNMKPNQ